MSMINKKLAEQLSRCMELAARAHLDQYRWDGQPYLLHPIRVMQYVMPRDNRHPTELHLKIAMVAILHDVIEDTDFSYEDLKHHGISDPEVHEALKLVTKDDYPDGATHQLKREIYEEYVIALAHNKIARRVKLADLHDNMNIKGPPRHRKLNPHRLEKYRWAFYYLTDIENAKHEEA